ncbi:hypothetical protein ABMA28_003535 [Loxostege sticticalis]|uniref:HTH CENPB-type domain-containing protein n=1 Tax=Loxostege sticticalis TaxID=481309 RepID=A0ABD0SZ26_LOXSC
MVRRYKRKTDNPSWTRESLCQAVDAVRSGLSGYEAAKTYGIPRKTIMDHVNGRRGQKSSTLGRPPVLSADTEKELANCLHVMERHGFGLSRKEVLQLVGQYVNQNKIETPFTDGIPGNDWFSNFMTRHNLSIKKPQAVEIARKNAADPFIIQELYNILEKVVKELELENKPEKIYNLDETSYCSDPKKTKVVGLKGYPSTRTTSSAGKANTTVLFASNAAGGKGPPFIIFKGKNVWSAWTSEEAYPGTKYSATPNGWIDSETFEEYMTKSFISMVKDDKEPTLLIFDGHSTHVQLSVVEKAKQNNITFIKLPPHSSHLLQPLDLGVFKPYKDLWDQEMVKWQRTNKGEKLPKDQFSVTVGKVWENLDPNVIKKGFEKSGIYPFNREAVPEHKLDPEALKKWKKHNEKLQKEQTPALNSPLTLSGLCLIKINSIFKLELRSVAISPSGSKSSEKISFEDLLIQSTKKLQTERVKRKNIKISASAEVITHEDVIQRLKQKEDDKVNKEREKEEKRKQRELKKKDIIIRKSEKITKKKVTKILYTKKQQKKIKIEDDEDLGEESDYTIHDSDTSDMDLESYSNIYLSEQNLMDQENVCTDFGLTDIEYYEETSHKLKKNDWVLVKFSTKKSVKHYIGQIIDIKDDIPIIKYVRKTQTRQQGLLFVFPNVDDICELKHVEDIVSILPTPTFTRRGQISFSINFCKFNIQ